MSRQAVKVCRLTIWWRGGVVFGIRAGREAGKGGKREGGRGGTYSFVACHSHLTIDHASLSRRRNVSTPNRDTSNSWALTSLFPFITLFFLLVLCTSCFAACGHHLSPRISIVFSVLLYQTSPCHILQFSVCPSQKHPVPPRAFHILPLCELYSIGLAQRHICASTCSSSRLLVYLVFFSGRSRSPTQNRSFSVFVKSIGPCIQFLSLPLRSRNSGSSYFALFLSASPSLARGVYSFVACLINSLTIGHASLSKRGGGGVYLIGDMYSISCMAAVV